MRNQRPKHTQKEFLAISPNGEEFISNNKNAFSRIYGLSPIGIRNCIKNLTEFHKGWKFKNLNTKIS